MAPFFVPGHIGCRKLPTGVFVSLFVPLCVLAAGCAAKAIPMEGEFLEANDLSGFVPALESLPDGVLANLNGGSIRTQIVTFQFAEGRRMYFCTNGAKPLFRQLQQDPHVSYCVYKPGEDLVVSINGDVVFEDDPAIKARLWNGSANLRRFYRGVDDPNMRPFYINADEVETFSSAGVKIYRLK